MSSTKDVGTMIISWPSITSLPVHVAGCVRSFVHDADVAAIMIQRWWRKKPFSNTWFEHHHVTRKAIHERFFTTQVAGHEKLDGTNFSINEEGHMFGRRTRAFGESYQKVPLESVKKADVSGLRKRLLLGPNVAQFEEQVRLVTLYGELMCNYLYHYNQSGIAKTWQCFGVNIKCTTDSVEKILDALVLDGYAGYVRTETDLLIVLNKKLREDLQALDLQHPKPVFTGTMAEMIQDKDVTEFMLKHQGEGIVVMISGDDTEGQTVIRKWKIGAEPQGRNVKELNSAIQLLTQPGILELVDQRITELLHKLVVVCETPGEAAENKKMKVDKKAQHALFESLYRDAYVSALTKFDALEAYFVKGGSGRTEIIKLLTDEVVSDLQVEGDKSKDVKRYVKSKVGTEFGIFMKAKAMKTQG